MIPKRETADVRLIKGIVRLVSRMRRALVVAAIALSLVIFVAFGVYTVPTNQTGALYTAGIIEDDLVEPGIHYKWPAPFQKVTIMNTSEMRRIVLSDKTEQVSAIITGDENLIDVDVALQYQIHDYRRFLIGARNWEMILTGIVEAELTEMVAGFQVDTLLTTGKSELQIGLRNRVQAALDQLDAGLVALSTRIVSATPPMEAAGSFRRVADAKSGKARRINRAQAKRSRALSMARGEAEKIVQQARSTSDERIKKADGESERYLHVLAEYGQAKKVTRTQMYYNAMENAVSVARVILFDPDAPLDLTLFRQIATNTP